MSRWREVFPSFVVYTLLGCVLLAGAFQALENFGGKDWNAAIGQAEAELVALRDYGQLPLWNPWRAGGQVSFAQPVSMFLSPVTPLVLLFGALLGFKLALLPLFVAGCLGTWALAGHLGLSGAARLVPGLVLFGSSIFPLYVVGGLPNWLCAMALLPWLLYFHRRALDDTRFVVGTALAYAGVLLCGGVDRFFFFALFLGADAALLSLSRRSLRPLTRLAAGLALGAMVTGIKFVPLIEVYSTAPRPISEHTRYVPPDMLPRLLLGTELPDLFSRGRSAIPTGGGNRVYWINAGSYVGPLALGLAALGALWLRRTWIPAATGLLFLWLAMGVGVQPSLWSALHRLPLFASMAGAERRILLVTFCLALLAGHGFALLERFVRARLGDCAWPPAAALLLLGTVAPMLFVNAPISRNAFIVPPPPEVDGGWLAERPPRPPFRQGRVPPHPLQWGGPLYPGVVRNEGNVLAQRNIPVFAGVRPHTHPHYRGEVYLLGRHGRIEPGPEITPDEIRVRATVKRPDLLVVNQAFFPGWRAEGTVDGPLVPFRGLLALRLPAGRHELALRYRPWTVAVGAGVSLVGLGLAALWWIYRPGRDGIRRAHDERVRREPADHSGRGSS